MRVTEGQAGIPGRGSTLAGTMRIYLLAAVIGALTGGLASAFHYCLQKAVVLHAVVASLFTGRGPTAVLAVALVGAMMVTAAIVLVRRFAPEAAGSGIQEIEGAMQGRRAVRWWRVIGVKFFGGVLSMGAGLLLGREGPTIHMGGCVGRMIGERTGADTHGMNTFLAAGAGAGLSAAFSAPVAGVIFVTEEMRRSFNYNFVSLHAVIAACIIAKVVNDQVFGLGPSLPVRLQGWLPAGPGPDEILIFVPLYLVLGILIGIGGAGFNRALLGCLRGADRLRWPVHLAAAATLGAFAGALTVVAPEFVGGGESLIKEVFAGAPEIGLLVSLLVVRAGMTFLSYATGAPGGIFAPMLALGTLVGVIFGVFVETLFPHTEMHAGAFAIAAMGGLFAATVRAPLTGIVLVAELTASFSLLMAMTLTCLSASITAQSLGIRPVYELLLARTLEAAAGPGQDGRDG